MDSFIPSAIALEQVHRTDAAASHQMGEAEPGALHLAWPRLAAELERQLVDLCQAGRTAGVAARDQSPVGVEWDPTAQAGLPFLYASTSRS